VTRQSKEWRLKSRLQTLECRLPVYTLWILQVIEMLSWSGLSTADFAHCLLHSHSTTCHAHWPLHPMFGSLCSGFCSVHMLWLQQSLLEHDWANFGGLQSTLACIVFWALWSASPHDLQQELHWLPIRQLVVFDVSWLQSLSRRF